MCAHMELTKQDTILVALPWAWEELPPWFHNCLLNMGLGWGMTAFQYTPIINKWFDEHYNARYYCQLNGPWTVEFPNQEIYMQCMLTWS